MPSKKNVHPAGWTGWTSLFQGTGVKQGFTPVPNQSSAVSFCRPRLTQKPVRQQKCHSNPGGKGWWTISRFHPPIRLNLRCRVLAGGVQMPESAEFPPDTIHVEDSGRRDNRNWGSAKKIRRKFSGLLASECWQKPDFFSGRRIRQCSRCHFPGCGRFAGDRAWPPSCVIAGNLPCGRSVHVAGPPE